MHQNRGFVSLEIFLVVWIAVASAASAADSAGAVEWPSEWVVIAPVEAAYPVADGAALGAIPEAMAFAASGSFGDLEVPARAITVEPGTVVDLTEVIGEARAGLTAYVFIPLRSPIDQTVRVGMGGDWWIETWINGAPLFDTLDHGNDKSPVSVLNHTIEVPLRAGDNVLAIRFMRGRASADLAVGGEQHFPAARAVAAAREKRRALNILPEKLADRLLFPIEEQAVATASWSIDLSLPDVDLSTGALVGLEAMPERQVYMNATGERSGEFRDTMDPTFDVPVKIMLSKCRYPAEDRHLDAIVWTTPPEGQPRRGYLEIILRDAHGQEVSRNRIDELSPSGWFFSVGLPPSLDGGEAALEVVWRDGGQQVATGAAAFFVEAPTAVQTRGRVPLLLLNEVEAVIANAPITVGVPFPRGALADADNVRLVDEAGVEIPLQAEVTGRWSRFGPVKWLLCDFTADFDGEPRTVYLEYGPDLERVDGAPIVVGDGTVFPAIDAGRLQVSDAGVAYDINGDGRMVPLLEVQALRGAFVTHEDGRVFTVADDVDTAVEEIGSEKAVIRSTGWYVEESTGKGFCQFVTRYVVHRDSPVVRIFHTWIFTGDGNRDRIADMGWRFATTDAVKAEGILVSHEENLWLPADNLVQYDYDSYNLAQVGTDQDGRTPGILAAGSADGRVLLGVKDFWQNFPSELEFDDAGFTFYNWPRNNPPATFERPLVRQTAFLHRFAHEGEVLDFRLPVELTEGDLWQEAAFRERHWAEGEPETTNAQGIARTEEMFLYFPSADSSPAAAARVLKGLNDESLRAIADPAWTAASGVLGNFHPRDTANYAEDEYLYEQLLHAPARWNEHLGFYGMWLYGDVPAWTIDLHRPMVSLYRTIRKNHHGWPIRWLPWARSGDPQLLKYAEAATRQMLDANFCHYVDEVVDESVGPDYQRMQGWWDRSLLQWAARQRPSTRTYTSDCDYIWQAYYMTGYARARDVLLLYGEATQNHFHAPTGPRTTSSMLPSYLDMYQGTFDPWFLLAAHTLAELHRHIYQRDGLLDKYTDALAYREVVDFWRPGDENFYRYTGCEEHGRLALNQAIAYSSPMTYGFRHRWDFVSFPYIQQAAFAWQETGDTYYLDRVAGYLDYARRMIYDGDLEYGRGSLVQGSTSRGIVTGYYMNQFPLALAALESSEYVPTPIPEPFLINGAMVEGGDPDVYQFQTPPVIIRKDRDAMIPVSLAHRYSGRGDGLFNAYSVVDPAGNEILVGDWPLDNLLRRVEIPAEAPDGNYTIQYSGKIPLPSAPEQRARVIRNQGLIRLPATPPDVPEVMLFPSSEEGTQVAAGRPEIQYFFLVPEHVSEFWIEFTGTSGDLSRVSVWDADGQRVWDQSYVSERPERVVIPVPADQAGRVWGASGATFLLDPRIPPYFSQTRGKWFDPRE